MTFDEWKKSVPQAITNDSLWRVEAYRLSLFLADLSMIDFPQLIKRRPTWSHADQLLRSAAAISSDIAEDYSRGTGKDRAKFFEYALGSATESRDWYYKARASLSESAVQHRIDLLTQIIRLLIRMVDTERKTNKRLLSASINNQQSP
jgi:four helix bundle protein